MSTILGKHGVLNATKSSFVAGSWPLPRLLEATPDTVGPWNLIEPIRRVQGAPPALAWLDQVFHRAHAPRGILTEQEQSRVSHHQRSPWPVIRSGNLAAPALACWADGNDQAFMLLSHTRFILCFRVARCATPCPALPTHASRLSAGRRPPSAIAVGIPSALDFAQVLVGGIISTSGTQQYDQL